MGYPVGSRSQTRSRSVPSKVLFEYRAPSPITSLREYRRRLREAKERARQEVFDSLPSFSAPTGPCGAKTRAGTPCKLKSVYSNGRCHLHGGLSTGPKTAAGKARSALNGCLGGRPKKPKSV